MYWLVVIFSIAISDYFISYGLRGFQIIGKIEISIRRVDESVSLFNKLEENLGLIEEIHGQLRVHRVDSLVSLDFFRSLTLINASGVSQLYRDQGVYAGTYLIYSNIFCVHFLVVLGGQNSAGSYV